MDVKIVYKTDPVPVCADLKKVLQRRAIKLAVKQAMQPMVQAVIANASAIRRFGFLALSIGTRLVAYANTVAGVIGPKARFRKSKGKATKGKTKGQPRWFRPAYYAGVVEKGSKRSKANPFLRPALNALKGKYLADVTARIAEEIQKALPR